MRRKPMIWLRVFICRLCGMFYRRKVERQLEEEICAHLEMQIEDDVRQGMSSEEALRSARRKFGGVIQIKEGYKDRSGLPLVESTLQDLQYASRMLRKNPGFALIAVMTLALGIGANAAIFSVVNGVLLRPLPYKDQERLLMVWATRSSDSEFPIMGGDFSDLRRENRVFEHVAAFSPRSLNLTGSGEPELLGVVSASPNLFSLLGRELIHGHAFLPENEQWGNHRFVVLSHNLWQRLFGSDPQVVGRTITLNDEPYTITGVAPLDFQFPNGGVWRAWFPPRVDIYIPLALTPEQMNNRRGPSLAVVA